MEIAAKRQQLENVTQQVEAQQAQNEELQRTTQADDEASYMERVAAINWAMRGRTSAFSSMAPRRAAEAAACAVLRFAVAGTVRFL